LKPIDPSKVLKPIPKNEINFYQKQLRSIQVSTITINQLTYATIKGNEDKE